MSITNFNTYVSSYSGISELLKTYTCDEIIAHVASMLNLTEEALRNYPMGGYSKGQTAGYYQFVIADLKKHILQYDKVYEMLADKKSKEVFTHLLQYRLFPAKQFLEQAYDATYPQYFDKDIVSCTKDEVFVDCGGFIGDTAEEFIKQYQNYKHIYVYEPSDDNIETCRSNLSKYPNITMRNCGIGEKNEQLAISNSKSSSNFLKGGDSEDKVQIVFLDEDIQEKVSFIKMDIEGFEIPGLLGAKNHIKHDTPKLAICTYHIVSDIWEIPLLIHEINPNYSYYFRHYRPDQNWETVVYAIPKNEAGEKRDAICVKTAVALCDCDGWENEQLTKGCCGLLLYLLHKNHGMDVTMVGTDKGPYPYLETYVKGLKMEFLETGSDKERIQYIAQHAKEIDLLTLYGPHITYFAVAPLYKKLNPSGKIYLALDANSHWMDRIDWDNPQFIQFMNSCDVIGTSCKAMQKHLNEKWPWKIEYMPNGYYYYEKSIEKPDFNQKENTILTVGRLGTTQKATHVLLEAFAKIADKIPNWKLKLVGSIDPAFHSVIEQYFKRYQGLASRVEFTGVISDKEQLRNEYEKAKVFALTSIVEAAPNVVCEALAAGCVTAMTKIDAWEDATDFGHCGKVAAINDIQGFSEILLELCNSPDLPQMSDNAYSYALRNYNLEKTVARLYEMLYGGDLVE